MQIAISNIMTQNYTKTTSTFTVTSFVNNYMAVDASTNSMGLAISQGNNFNSISLVQSSYINSATVSYTIYFEQLQNFTNITTVRVTFNPLLSLTALSRIFELVYNPTYGNYTQVPCLFSSINSVTRGITLSQSTNASHILRLESIQNPPSQAPLSNPITVSTVTSNYSFIYSSMPTQ